MKKIKLKIHRPFLGSPGPGPMYRMNPFSQALHCTPTVFYELSLRCNHPIHYLPWHYWQQKTDLSRPSQCHIITCLYTYFRHSVPITTSCEFLSRSCRGVLDTTLCDKVCQYLATGRQYSPGTPVSEISEMLLKVA